MQDSERRAFYETWASAWEQCGKSVTDRMLKFAFECLKQFTLTDIQRAVLAHAQNPDTGQFAPKPADIIAHIEGGGDEQSLRAWQTVEETVKRVGPYRAIVFEDPVTHSAVEQIGGYSTLCRATNDEWPFIRRNFCNLYRGMRARPPAGNQVPLIAESDGGQEPLLVKTSKAPLMLEVDSAA